MTAPTSPAVQVSTKMRSQKSRRSAGLSPCAHSGVENNQTNELRRLATKLSRRTSQPLANLDSGGTQKNPCGLPSASHGNWDHGTGVCYLGFHLNDGRGDYKQLRTKESS